MDEPVCFMGWRALFPACLEEDTAVSKSPFKEIIPQFDFSRSLHNNGPSLALQITQSIARSLGNQMGCHSSWAPQSSRKVYNTNQIPKTFIKNVRQKTHLTWRAMSVIVFLSTHPAQLSFGSTSLQSALWACCSVFGAVAEVQMLVLPSSLTNYQKLRVTKSDYCWENKVSFN